MNVAILFSGRIAAYEYQKEYLTNLQQMYNAKIFCSINKNEVDDYHNEFFNIFDIKDGQYHFEGGRNNYSSMSYNRNKCMELIEAYEKTNNMTFDCIIYFRADIITNDILKISTLENNTIYTGLVDWHYYGNGFNGYNLCDHFAFGNKESMKKYCYIDKTEYYTMPLPMSPHELLFEQLTNNNVRIVGIEKENFSWKLNDRRCDKIYNY
jgi:hypothetical protein